MKYNQIQYMLIALAGLLCLLSCGPVNFLTRVQKVPLRYSVNYNYANVKAEKSELNRKAWVVYSDRAGNVTTIRPGGTLPHKELRYMEPLLVIGSKGDYYKLLKYDPAILENERLSKRKDAEFYGWIHKDLLLLFNASETEIRNGIKLKSLAAIADCRVMLEAEKYFSEQSVVLHSAPKLDTACGTVELNSIVYVLKALENEGKVLISQKNALRPDEAESMSIGWVDASLIAPFGQRLVCDVPPGVLSPEPLTSGLWERRPTVSPVSVSPLLYVHRGDTIYTFRTLDASEIFDHSDNKIYNVDGNPITYELGSRISDELKHVNVIFAFIPTKNVVQQMPMISNAIQNLKPIFETSLVGFDCCYAGVMGKTVIDFETDYLSFSDRLIEAGKGIGDAEFGDFTTVMRHALSLAARKPNSTHAIVLIGEQSAGWSSIPEDIKRDFIRADARLLSYQVYADNEDIYNNFVLQSLDVIEYYAEKYATLKRSRIVYSDQLCPQNLFLEGVKNAYSLDFPTRSMTQGMVVFPEKGRSTEPELLITVVDTLVRQIAADNLRLIGSIERAFMQVGRRRSRFQESVATHLHIDPQTRIAPHIGKAFNDASPQWVKITDRIQMPVDSVNMSALGLLLTDAELEEIKVWVEKLSLMKPDIKGNTAGRDKKIRPVKRVRRDLSSVPADIVNGAANPTELPTDSVTCKYAPTGAIRKHLATVYLKALENCVFEGRARRLTLAQAQENITTLPTLSVILNGIAIKDLKKKKRLPDWELDLLIEYFEERKGEIDEQVKPVEDLSLPGGETFFFLPSEAMP